MHIVVPLQLKRQHLHRLQGNFEGKHCCSLEWSLGFIGKIGPSSHESSASCTALMNSKRCKLINWDDGDLCENESMAKKNADSLLHKDHEQTPIEGLSQKLQRLAKACMHLSFPLCAVPLMFHWHCFEGERILQCTGKSGAGPRVVLRQRLCSTDSVCQGFCNTD